ncbi:hypothetical protein L195_g027336 [Trifolium pratense]|uniref:Uncharacterized protein n=1 Tax=Trifolium pratense TaxID=57577 RepID=A0A2K3KYU4_TRIPR|nr:hypothetical protein L195_g027336 [Trifolium pratense]
MAKVSPPPPPCRKQEKTKLQVSEVSERESESKSITCASRKYSYTVKGIESEEESNDSHNLQLKDPRFQRRRRLWWVQGRLVGEIFQQSGPLLCHITVVSNTCPSGSLDFESSGEP